MSGFPNARPELDYLLACVRAEAASELSPPLDERSAPRVLRQAQLHGLVPLLDRQLAASASIRIQVHEAAAANSRNALLLAHELLSALGVLNSRGVSAVAYKGPLLAAITHGDVAQRQYCDLDVLVHRRDLEKAISALSASGYRSALQYYPGQAHVYFHAACEWPMFTPAGALIELQWQLVPHYFALALDFDAVFRRAVAVPLGGANVPTLAPEDHFLALCIHAAKHGWERLSWGRDLANFARRMPLRWDWIVNSAQAAGALRILFFGIRMAEWIAPLDLPADLERMAQHDVASGAIARAAQVSILSGLASASGDESPGPEYFRYLLALRERRADRVRMLRRLATTPGVGDLAMARLPKPLAPVYSLLRVGRLASRVVRTLLPSKADKQVKLEPHSRTRWS